MKPTKYLTLLSALFIALFSYSQKGKHGSPTLSGTSYVNEYTTLSSNASSGATTISVASSTLNGNGRFSNNLEAGDLIMIIQVQGATMTGSQITAPWGYYGSPDNTGWGALSAYNNCGNHEFCEVKSIPNGTTIELRCGLAYDYTSSGNVQVVRVPRYDNLTISGTLTTDAWDGSTGGVLAIEVDNTLNLNGTIDVSALGFRGGTAWDEPATNNIGVYAISNADAGGLKGEGVRGFMSDYDIHGGRYGKGAAINGGGGGNSHNCGGGGGGNAGSVAGWNNGIGVPDATYATAWAQDPEISGTGTGGGRGGYGHSDVNATASSNGPDDGAWGGHDRPNDGGLGGRPLDYSTGRIFLGGGGGAGQRNDNYNSGGAGGNGGGIAYILNYGDISGTGTINANGGNGEDVYGTTAATGWNQVKGNDGAGGAGAGGTVLVKSNGTISAITINANGGNGGNQIVTVGFPASVSEAEGPGGGGGGGYVATTGGSATTTANGGTSGTTDSAHLTEFPPNGATDGGTGQPSESISNFYLTGTDETICAGTSTTLNVTVNGTLPGGTNIIWYDAEVDGNFIGAGTSFTTGNLSVDTTFYVGTCPGNYLIPVNVTMGSSFTTDDSNINITPEDCGQGNGAISGITVTGGALPLVFEWNGTVEVSQDISGLSAGNYTLVITDDNGCFATVGTYTVGNTTGVTLDATNININHESCTSGNGSITGITTTGGTGTLTYEWNGNSSVDENLSNANAGSYTLTVTDANGCTDSSGPHVINNNAGPVIDSTSYSLINESCGGGNGSISGITVSGGNPTLTYEWNGVTSASLDISNLSAGTYTLVITDGLGCIDSTGVYTVVDNAGPTIDTTGYSIQDENCGQGNGSITGIVVSGGNPTLSYDWSGTSTANADLTGAASGTYNLTVTDGLGCIVTTGPYTVNSIDLVVDTTSFIIIDDACSQGNGGVTGITVTGGVPNYDFSWNGNTTTTADLSGVGAGSYSLTISDQAGCTFVTGPYDIVATTGPTIDTTNMVITPDACGQSNGSITGIVYGGGTAPYTFEWNGNSSPDENLTGTAAGDYTITITDNTLCASTLGPITIGSVAGPTVDDSGLTVTDEDCYAGDGAIAGLTIVDGTAPYTIDWNGNGALIDTSNLSAGTYTLTVTDDYNCVTTYGPITVNNSGAPTASFTVTNNPTAPDEIVLFTNTSSADAVTFDWDFGNGLTSTDVDPTTIYDADGTYTVCLIASTASNCQDTACVNVVVSELTSNVIGLPSAFSPNNDGHNDVLMVRGSGITTMKFMVFNRYGEKVFESTDPGQGWDGTYKGQDENAGIFVYIVDYTLSNGETGMLKGNVTLVK